MDIEQLRLVLEMVGAAGEGAKDLALLWFALAFFKVTAAWAFAFTFIFVGLRLIKQVCAGNAFLNELAGLMGTYLPLTTNEKQAMRRAIKKGYEG